VVISMVDGSFSSLHSTARAWHIDAVRGRPPHQILTVGLKAMPPKGFEPKDGEGGRGDCLPEHDAKLGERLISAGREPGQ